MNLVEGGLGTDGIGIPYELRNLVWGVLRPLTDDPEPDAEYEREYGGGDFVGTIRGWAMYTAIRYGRWVRDHCDDNQHPNSALAAMPELREVLDLHLDPAHDPSITVRSVYGAFFWWLYDLDASWTTRSIDAIFPVDAELRHLYEASWKAYVTRYEASDMAVAVLRAEYVRAIEHLEPRSDDESFPEDERGLAEDVVALYWQGALELDSLDGLVSGFYGKASASLRRHVAVKVGEQLEYAEELPERILPRLRKLWEWRLKATEGPRSPADGIELVAFGYWFASAKFDTDWALANLSPDFPDGFATMVH